MAALALLAAAAAAVSWDAQYLLVRHIKHAPAIAALEAGIPDVGALIFATLGIALALHAKHAVRARTLNIACVGISLAMNALASAPGWRDLAVWIMPSAVYAVASDTLIGVVRAWAVARAHHTGQVLAEVDATPMAILGGFLLWLLRLALAPVSTIAGFRRWVVEDTRGGFTHGGWGPRYDDEVLGREMAKAMAKPGDMLLGRRTWQDFITVWGRATDGNPFTARMNATTKYVVSTTLENADAWQNSILLRGDAVDTVAELKAQSDRDLGIIGSASLVRTLHAAGLIDRYTLVICPLTLGSGTRLFEGPAPRGEFELTGSVTTTKGVIIAQYTRQ